MGSQAEGSIFFDIYLRVLSTIFQLSEVADQMAQKVGTENYPCLIWQNWPHGTFIFDKRAPNEVNRM